MKDFKKILVTGANGYIGCHVVKQLLDDGHEVVATDIHFNDTNVDKRVMKIESNIFAFEDSSVFEYFGCPDVCIHMAWRNGFVHNSPTQMGDLSAHYKFLTAMIDGGLKHLAVMGSMHEVGYWEGAIDENTPCAPQSMYGIAKDALRRSITLYCTNSMGGCLLQWLRCYYILGDDQRNNSIFCKILEADEQGKTLFPFTSGKNKYDFIQVNELAKLISKVVSQNEVTGIINCCTGKPISLAERVEQFIKDNHLSIRLDYGKFPDRPYDSPIVYGDATKIQQILSFFN